MDFLLAKSDNELLEDIKHPGPVSTASVVTGKTTGRTMDDRYGPKKNSHKGKIFAEISDLAALLDLSNLMVRKNQ
jgi:hypothetical protein